MKGAAPAIDVGALAVPSSTGRVARAWPRTLGWGAAALALAALVLSPIASLVLAAARGDGTLWPHLLAHVLPRALVDTGLLLAGVGVLVVVLGTGAAWLVSAYAFPGRRWLEAGLLLPMAVPTYIVAYAYLDLMHPIGPVQTVLREWLGYARPRDFVLPELRSLPGCILLLGFVLYPYVYLPTRALFLMQAANLIEAGRMLGRPPAAVFLRVALPLARPAIALGASLALMEALNDIGAAEFLGVRTLTVQVYATWVNRSDLPGAAQIALVMLVAVLGLVAIERWARRGRGFAGTAQRPRDLARRPLRGWRGWAALALGLVPVTLGFLIPASYLVHAAVARVARTGWPATILPEIGNTVLYASLATGLAAGIGFLVAAAPRLLPGRLGRGMVRLTGLGYALPGAILAIGLLGPLALADTILSEGLTRLFGAAPALIGLGTGGALVIAYLIRFLAVSVGTCEAGLGRIPRSLPDAGRMLGRGPAATLARVQWPLAWPAVLSGALLVFVDCVKELPATLLLRPLNVETLATHLYGEAARGTYEDGTVAALLIVLVGLVPVIVLMRLGTRREAAVAARP
ncbi:iron ABC transporter permease [Methylobacterium sp. Leaf102]|uniref:ABC transporter permease n=1 Tax=Methylobacterium sp. Leaf102 TaxID=1736253 RepID=UPI0009EAC5BE|nr:iron ABC transporter permease [Methylobacterium sp. Leaf102]